MVVFQEGQFEGGTLRVSAVGSRNYSGQGGHLQATFPSDIPGGWPGIGP